MLSHDCSFFLIISYFNKNSKLKKKELDSVWYLNSSPLLHWTMYFRNKWNDKRCQKENMDYFSFHFIFIYFFILDSVFFYWLFPIVYFSFIGICLYCISGGEADDSVFLEPHWGSLLVKSYVSKKISKKIKKKRKICISSFLQLAFLFVCGESGECKSELWARTVSFICIYWIT